jgi:RNA polymerase sigma factor (sigma-70 family)
MVRELPWRPRPVMSPGIPTRLLVTQSDERLLTLVRQGHERAFEALVHRYRRPLLAYCRRLSLPPARGEDVVQLALLKLWIAVREGTEVRDLKAWLYRVAHNVAVNTLRDSCRDTESLADPVLLDAGTHSSDPSASRPHVGRRLRPATDESPLEHNLQMRDTLAEVAALPPLQREVIVRTAVAGHSHEQVASDLGITNGAVRGLLYRARLALRTAITVLTPPPLLALLAGRSEQSGPAPERLAELAGGGGSAGLGGLLLKGGLVAITAGTVVTGAAVVHIDGLHRHRDHRRPTAVASIAGAAGAESASAQPLPGVEDGVTTVRRSLSPTGAHLGQVGHAGTKGHLHGEVGHTDDLANAFSGARGPRPSTQTSGGAQGDVPEKTQTSPGASSPGAPSGGSGSSGSASQGGGAGPGDASGAGSGSPGGGAAGDGSDGDTGTGGGAGQAMSPGGASGGGQSGSGSGSGPGASGQEGSGEGSAAGGSGGDGSASGSGSGGSGESSGDQPNGSGGSESAGGGESSGSLVGAVVHEVSGILEHLLH